MLPSNDVTQRRTISLIALSQVREWMRRTALVAIKLVAVIAAVVFTVANPLRTNSNSIAFFVSVPVLLFCLWVWLLLGGNDGDHGSGYWPKPPE